MTPAILHGDAAYHLRTLGTASVECVITSPPYWHGDGSEELGGEPSAAPYITRLVALFTQVQRVIVPDGTCWLILGDRDRPPVGVRWRVAHALVDAGWTLAAETSVGLDTLFRLHPTPAAALYYGPTVARARWDAPDAPLLTDAPYAPLSLDLIDACLTTSTTLGDHVLDPFCGLGTVGRVATDLGRTFCGIDLDPLRCALARTFMRGGTPRLPGLV